MLNETINISGKIDDLLSHFPIEMRKNELLNKMVNCPIMNDNKIIGMITDYDLENGLWYGNILKEFYPSITDNCICSMEIKNTIKD